MRKFGLTAGDDLDNLTHLVGEGATRLQGMAPFLFHLFSPLLIFFFLIFSLVLCSRAIPFFFFFFFFSISLTRLTMYFAIKAPLICS